MRLDQLKIMFLAFFWLLWSLFLQWMTGLGSWSGVHVYGQYDLSLLWSPFCIWVHLDAVHALNNALLGVWIFIQVQKQLGFIKGLALGFGLALDLTLFEELVHLWSPLPAAQGASGWLYAHLPLCVYWALRYGWWRKWTWSACFVLFVLIEDLVFKLLSRDFFTASTCFHLMGLVLGLGWLGVIHAWSNKPLRDN